MSPSSAPIKVGIAGYGNSSRNFHIPFLLPPSNENFELVAILQRTSPEDAKTKGSRHATVDYPDAKWHDNTEGFMKDEQVELVLVLTGHTSHTALAEAAMRAGKHVVVEKPFTATSEEADQLIKTRDEMGVILSPFQNRRYDSDTQTMLKLIASGHLGTLTDVDIHYDLDSPSWAAGKDNQSYAPGSGEGILLGLGVHIIDQALAAFGRPYRVTGFLRSLLSANTDIDDTFTVILEYDYKPSPETNEKRTGPLLVTLKTHMQSIRSRQFRMSLRGTEGSFIKYGDDQQESQTGGDLKPGDEGFGVEPEDIHGTLETRKKVLDSQKQQGGVWVGKVVSEVGDYRRYYNDVAKAIRGEGKLVIGPEVSRDGIKITELARQSWKERRSIAFE